MHSSRSSGSEMDTLQCRRFLLYPWLESRLTCIYAHTFPYAIGNGGHQHERLFFSCDNIVQCFHEFWPWKILIEEAGLYVTPQWLYRLLIKLKSPICFRLGCLPWLLTSVACLILSSWVVALWLLPCAKCRVVVCKPLNTASAAYELRPRLCTVMSCAISIPRALTNGFHFYTYYQRASAIAKLITHRSCALNYRQLSILYRFATRLFTFVHIVFSVRHFEHLCDALDLWIRIHIWRQRWCQSLSNVY